MRYETVRMILEIKRRMTDDALYTSHRPATDGDAKRLASWPSGGIVQVAHGLLVEALRREALALVLTQMAKGRTIETLDEDELDGMLRARIIDLASQLSRGSVASALRDVQAMPSPRSKP